MVKESELVEGLRARAKLIVEHEQLFPWRQTYARYLHVAEAVAEDTAQAPWDGLGGRLKALRRGQAEAKAGQAKARYGRARQGKARQSRKAKAQGKTRQVCACMSVPESPAQTFYQRLRNMSCED